MNELKTKSRNCGDYLLSYRATAQSAAAEAGEAVGRLRNKDLVLEVKGTPGGLLTRLGHSLQFKGHLGLL